MDGWVGIKQLRLLCHLGVTEEERTAKQEVLVDVAVRTAMPKEDDLEEALDYRSIRDDLFKIASAKPHQLIEALASEMVRHLQTLSQVQGVRLRLEKPRALSCAACSFVEIEAPCGR